MPVYNVMVETGSFIYAFLAGKYKDVAISMLICHSPRYEG